MNIEKVLPVFLLLAAAGCASLNNQPLPRAVAPLSPVSCSQYFIDLDAAIDVAGIRDGSETQMETFPYLRANRFLASFAADFQATGVNRDLRFAAWVEELRRLDIAAREAEISNLPAAALADVAAACGFSSQQHLTNTMRHLTGTTPGHVRRSAKGLKGLQGR